MRSICLDVANVVELGLALVLQVSEHTDDNRAVALVSRGHRIGQLTVVIVVDCRPWTPSRVGACRRFPLFFCLRSLLLLALWDLRFPGLTANTCFFSHAPSWSVGLGAAPRSVGPAVFWVHRQPSFLFTWSDREQRAFAREIFVNGSRALNVVSV